MNQIVQIDRLKPYFKIAEAEAKKSSCTVRKVGALIVRQGFDIDYVAAHNKRISQCCDTECIRTRLSMDNDKCLEIGAEIHAEMAVLIQHGPRIDDGEGWLNNYLLLAGFDGKGKRKLYGKNIYPCHICSLGIKYAGFTHVYVETTDGITAVSISAIIEEEEISYGAEV